jgi:hypothetical protein
VKAQGEQNNAAKTTDFFISLLLIILYGSKKHARILPWTGRRPAGFLS